MTLEPWMFDLVLIGVAAEFALLALLLARSGHRAWAWPLLWFLVSGALLMAAVRGAVAGVPDAVVGGVLFVSLLTHAACLWTAWRLVRSG
ncbi:MAG: hypothetical protein ACK4P2_05730 [Hyphomonas sp.]